MSELELELEQLRAQLESKNTHITCLVQNLAACQAILAEVGDYELRRAANAAVSRSTPVPHDFILNVAKVLRAPVKP